MEIYLGVRIDTVKLAFFNNGAPQSSLCLVFGWKRRGKNILCVVVAFF